ncbi:MAG: beta-ketoacyl-ACP synthase II [Chloroflexi bacterium]|nr:beta-ketoacyl-ACP synthase II [Chloroflexota bacterium]
MRRAVITGIGSVNPLGLSWEETWPRLVAGESGVGPITLFDAAAVGVVTRIAGEVNGFDPAQFMDAKAARRMDRFTQFAVAAVGMALRGANLAIDDANRDDVAVLFSTGAGGLASIVETEHVLQQRGPGRVSPFAVPMLMSNAAAGQVGIQFGARGMGGAFVSACASGNDALGLALMAIQTGRASAVIAGASEACITPLCIASFNQAGALSTSHNDDPAAASRPFDRDRDGFVLAEMGTALIVEELEHARARGARMLAELAGYGASMDAFHLTAPAPDGNGAVRAMRAALDSAGVVPADVDYVNAHGTSTALNDKIETLALKTVFGDHAFRLPISSTKSMVGHSAGGCGAFEAAVCAGAIQHGVVPPTINYATPDPECDLDYVPNVARRVDVRVALSNTFGFGGHNACIVLRRVE